MTAAQRRCQYHVLLRHHTANALLLLQQGHGWALPNWTTDQLQFWQSVEHINTALHDTLNVDVMTLRCIETHHHPKSNTVQRVYEAWVHSPDWTPPPSVQWVTNEVWPTLPLSLPEQRPWLHTWFAEAQHATPTQRRPWAQPGWFALMEHWITDQLQHLGIAPTGPVAQVRTWERSCVLRVPTTGNDVYAKAVPTMFAHEPALARVLAQMQPVHVHSPLAVDEEQRWLLTHAWSGQPLDQ